MSIGFLPYAALAFTAPYTPRCSVMAPRRAYAPITAAIDPAAAASLKENLPAILGAVALGGGAILAYNQNQAKEEAKAAASVAEPPPTPVAPPPPPPPVASTWGLSGRRGVSPHRMTGTMPKTPPREIWIAPPGWTPPKKADSVFSWYDKGQRLVGA